MHLIIQNGYQITVPELLSQLVRVTRADVEYAREWERVAAVGVLSTEDLGEAITVINEYKPHYNNVISISIQGGPSRHRPGFGSLRF